MTSIDEQPTPVGGVSTQDAKKHFARNTFANLLFFFFNAGTSLYMVPFQIAHLGLARYGMVGVANAFVSYLQVLTVALVGPTFRFVTVSLAKGDRDEANSYLNTHLVASIYFIAILLPVSAVLSYFTPDLLRIPPGEEANTRVLFFLVYASFMLALAGAPFQVPTYVKQRFDIRNYLDITNQVFRYSTWIILFAVIAPQLWQIGLGYVLGAGIALMGTIAVVRKMMPELCPRLKGFDRRKFIEMVRMGKWVGLEQLGSMLYWSTDMIVINLMLGPASAGRYSTIWLFALMLRAVVSMMANMVSPTTIAAYARQEWDTVLTNLARAVKFMSLGLAVPLGVFSGLAVPFLTWWLGPSFTPLYILVWLMISHQVINSAIEPVGAIPLAANKVTAPCVATIAGGVLKVVLSIALIKCTHWGVVSVAVAGLITFTLRNLVFAPVYAGRILSKSSWRVYRALVPGAIVFAGVAAATLGLAHRFNLATFPRLAGAGLALMALGAAVVYFIALDDQDRRFLKEVAPRRNQA
jgi:O-antigen/teichoic acid export membrane protein